MWEKIKLAMTAVFEWLKPLIKIILTEIKEEGLELALEVVTSLASADMSNSEKREAAFSQLKAQLKAGGKEVADSLIYTMIELAVQKLKSLQ